MLVISLFAISGKWKRYVRTGVILTLFGLLINVDACVGTRLC